jgi:SAM-dependent methyltransferase
MMSTKKPDLDAAYSLDTPEDSIDLYRNWAATYDTDFAVEMDYVYPAAVAAVFAEYAGVQDAPVLDVGAGTGLVGAALSANGQWQIDGLDISAEMLAVAMGKGAYRAVHVADLTGAIDLPDGQYGGVISAGTFTHGHVGPQAFDELLRLAAPNALFVIGINAAVYKDQGFEAKFRDLADQIVDFMVLERLIYGDKTKPDHKDDIALVAVFRKARVAAGG